MGGKLSDKYIKNFFKKKTNVDKFLVRKTCEGVSSSCPMEHF